MIHWTVMKEPLYLLFYTCHCFSSDFNKCKQPILSCYTPENLYFVCYSAVQLPVHTDFNLYHFIHLKVLKIFLIHIFFLLHYLGGTFG